MDGRPLTIFFFLVFFIGAAFSNPVQQGQLALSVFSPVPGSALRGGALAAIDLNVSGIDANVSSLSFDINYSALPSQGSGVPIVASGFAGGAVPCDLNNVLQGALCHYSWAVPQADGNFHLLARVLDGNFFAAAGASDGNRLAFAATGRFIIDSSAPSTSLSASASAGSADVNLSCSDGNGSGCAATKYRFDSNSAAGVSFGQWADYNVTLRVTGDGNFGVEYYSQDRAGNSGVSGLAYVIIQPAAPDANMAVPDANSSRGLNAPAPDANASKANAPPDVNAPVITLLAPLNASSVGTAVYSIRLSTNELASCTFSLNDGNEAAFAATNGGMNHLAGRNSDRNGSYAMHIICADSNSNMATLGSNYTIAISGIAPDINASADMNVVYIPDFNFHRAADPNSGRQYLSTYGVAFLGKVKAFIDSVFSGILGGGGGNPADSNASSAPLRGLYLAPDLNYFLAIDSNTSPSFDLLSQIKAALDSFIATIAPAPSKPRVVEQVDVNVNGQAAKCIGISCYAIPEAVQ